MAGAGKWRRQDAEEISPIRTPIEESLGEMVRADREPGDTQTQLADLEELIEVSHSKETLQQDDRRVESQTRAAGPLGVRAKTTSDFQGIDVGGAYKTLAQASQSF